MPAAPERALELLALERGVLTAEEARRLVGASPAAGSDLVLAGHLVALGRVRPEELPALLAEAARRARTCPRCQRAVLLTQEGACSRCGSRLDSGVTPPPTTPPPTSPAFRGAATVVDEQAAIPPPDPLRAQVTAVEPLPSSLVDAGGSSSSTAPGSDPADGVPPAIEHRRRVGRYELVEQLGRGAMGVVYRARDPEHPQRSLALKLLRGGDQASHSRRRRFEEELRLLLRLDHPALVRVRDGGIADGSPYYVMDLISGRDLSDVIRQGALRPAEAVQVIAKLARALDHAHQQGVVHRDIKPENVRVDAALSPTLIDFGLAKDLEEGEGLTRTGTVVGTPYYMAPEQAAGRIHEIDPRTDVWALGVLLYELLTRELPFQDQDGEGLTRKILRAEAPSLLAARPDVPPALDAVYRRALAKRREDRWPGASALADALEAALEADAGGGMPMAGLLAVVAMLAAGLAVLALLRGPGLPGEGVAPRPPLETPAPPASAAPASPRDPLQAGRTLARAGRLEEAAAALGRPGERSFLRAERRWLLSHPDEPLGEGLALALAAEAGCDRAAARRACELLHAPASAGSPAALEGRARAALLLRDAEAARAACAAALEGAPDDPEGLRTAARARAAALAPEALRADLSRLEGHPDPALEGELARGWAGVVRDLVAARERESEGCSDEARVWVAWARGEQARRLAAAGRPPADRELCAAWREAGDELAPLLAQVPASRIRAARVALVGAGRSGSSPALESAEAELAAAAAAIPAPRAAAARAAVLLAARQDRPDARVWAEVWLGLAGDLPARALLALGCATRREEPRERLRQLERALRMAPELPQVQLARVYLAAGREAGMGARDGPGVLALARAGAAAPDLLQLALLPLQTTPLSPAEQESALAALAGQDDRDGHLARAMVRLYAQGADRESMQAAAAEALEATLEDPSCAAAHLLRARALERAGADPSSVRGALARAKAAAPSAAAVERACLLDAGPDGSPGQLETLILQGYLARLRGFLGQGRSGEVPLPPALAELLPPDLDLARPLAVADLVTKLNALEVCPRLHLGLALTPRPTTPQDWLRMPQPPFARSRRWREQALARAEESLEARLAGLDPQGPERWAAESLVWRRALGPNGPQDAEEQTVRARAGAAALRALHLAGPAGGVAVPARAQLLASGVLPPGAPPLAQATLPDAPELAWTWFTALRRPDLQLVRLTEELPADEGGLACTALAAPWSRARALLEAVQVAEAQSHAADWLLAAGETAEVHLALVRAAAFSRGAPRSSAGCREEAQELSRSILYGPRAATPGPMDLLEGYLREGLARWEDDPAGAGGLQAELADLLLWRAGLEPVGSSGSLELLERARAAVQAATAPGSPQVEPPFWGHWRLARLHAACEESEAAGHEIALALGELESRGLFLPDWRRRAVLRDPLRPLLERLSGYDALVEAVTPTQ